MTTPLSLEDRWGIYDLLAKYAVGLDAHDIDAVSDLFLPDGVLDTHEREFVGPAVIRKMLSRAPQGLHLAGAATVEAADYGASARQQLVFIEAGSHEHRLALYDDEIVRVDGAWKFRRRECRFITADGTLSPFP